MQQQFINLLSQFNRSLNIIVPQKFNYILANPSSENKKLYITLLEKLLSSLDEINIQDLNLQHKILYLKLEQNSQYNLQLNLSFEMRFLNPGLYLPFIALSHTKIYSDGSREQQAQNLAKEYIRLFPKINNQILTHADKVDTKSCNHSFNILNKYLKSEFCIENMARQINQTSLSSKFHTNIVSYRDLLQNKVHAKTTTHEDLFLIHKNKTIKADCFLSYNNDIIKQKVSSLEKIKNKALSTKTIIANIQLFCQQLKLDKNIYLNLVVTIYQHEISALMQPTYNNIIQLNNKNIAVFCNMDDLLTNESVAIFIISILLKDQIKSEEYHQNLLPVTSIAWYLSDLLQIKDAITLFKTNLNDEIQPTDNTSYPIYHTSGEITSQYLIYQKLMKENEIKENRNIIDFLKEFYQQRELSYIQSFV
ncbi:MAG: hypothetical protein DRQ51_06135 [Gammaproteobacteria bacterium]|nr:MAG: hypothetical protein DRQ51_06135 [Gammaproteobacteria bacterium]